MLRLTALSIAQNAREWMIHTHQARALNIFDNTINLIDERGEVCSIVSLKIGDGPFNIVVKEPEYSFHNWVSTGSPIRVRMDSIVIGEMIIDTQQAATSISYPDWKQLHSHRDEICTRILNLMEWIQDRTPIGSLIDNLKYPAGMQDIRINIHDFSVQRLGMRQRNNYPLYAKNSYPLNTTPIQSVSRSFTLSKTDFMQAAIKPARDLCSSIIRIDIGGCRQAAQHLAGLGPGLTPAGDDFILGAIYAAWIIHPEETAIFLTKELARTAAPLTASLSAAWLIAASKGEAAVRWHDLFGALCTGQKLQVQNAVDRLLSTGHTSGADSLAGTLGTFLCFMNPGL